MKAAALEAAADAGLGHRFEGWVTPWNFAGTAETEDRLAAAGFVDVECWLQPWPLTPDEPRRYLEIVCLGPHLERLQDDERGRFLDAVMARLGERPLLDYVRLNVVARRAT
jgi:trans-aconitate 2-methyltransferase